MTDTRTIFTAHDIPDLLNALPTLFGFRPNESLVAVATRGPRRRFGFRLRVDIPPPGHVDELADLVVGHLRHQGAEGAVLIAVTERQDVARQLLAAIEERLGEIETVVSVRADGAHYWVDEPDFPLHGIAYQTSDHHLSIVKAVAAGQQILPDREALAARFKPIEEPRRSGVMEVVRDVAADIFSIAEAHQLAEAVQQIRPLFETCLHGARVSDEDAVLLSVWLSRRDVRDEVWSWITRDNATAVLALLTHVSSIVVPPFEPPVLSLTAFAAWLSGDGAQALIAVERALAVDPMYSMARGVLELIEAGVSPVHWGDS